MKRFIGVLYPHNNENIVKDFLHRSKEACNPGHVPELFNQNIKGGGGKHKIAIKSQNDKLDCVLLLFRDIVPLWDGRKSYQLCNHKFEPNFFYTTCQENFRYEV